MQVTLRIVIALMFLGSGLSPILVAQETVDTPALNVDTPALDADAPALRKADSAPAPVPSAAAEESLPSPAATATDDNRWRYRQHGGQWWYWLPSNRWVVWNDGHWIDPPAESLATGPLNSDQYQTAPQYVVPRATGRILEPRPRSWYYTDRTYDGPYYYYDEFYSPYGGARPYSYYPVPRPYPRPGYYGRYPGSYGRYPYQGAYGRYPYYNQPGVGFSIGGGRSGVRIGIGF